MTGLGWGEPVRLAHAEATRNRAMVLSHPDLAKRLLDYPLHLGSPEQWSGYLPPVIHNGVHNDSPIRAQLVHILTDAHARTKGGQTALLETSLEPPPDDDEPEPEEETE
jgi:hypothetical protein